MSQPFKVVTVRESNTIDRYLINWSSGIQPVLIDYFLNEKDTTLHVPDVNNSDAFKKLVQEIKETPNVTMIVTNHPDDWDLSQVAEKVKKCSLEEYNALEKGYFRTIVFDRCTSEKLLTRRVIYYSPGSVLADMPNGTIWAYNHTRNIENCCYINEPKFEKILHKTRVIVKDHSIPITEQEISSELHPLYDENVLSTDHVLVQKVKELSKPKLAYIFGKLREIIAKCELTPTDKETNKKRFRIKNAFFHDFFNLLEYDQKEIEKTIKESKRRIVFLTKDPKFWHEKLFDTASVIPSSDKKDPGLDTFKKTPGIKTLLIKPFEGFECPTDCDIILDPTLSYEEHFDMSRFIMYDTTIHVFKPFTKFYISFDVTRE